MRPKTLILFIVAIGCGLVASIGVSQYMEKAKGNAGTAVETAKIYVATTEISAGERLDAKNVRLEEWPKDRIPEGAVSDLKQLEEKFPRNRMFKGEPILQAKLSDMMDGNLSQSIPVGYGVVGVKVDETTSGGGLLRPGDRVDVVVFLRKSAEISETGTRTILRDVNVFAVQGETERQVDKQGTARDVRTVSLLVTPKQAESVTLAKEVGVLSLTLRRPGDSTEDIGDGENLASLLGNAGEDANENKNKKKQPQNGNSGLTDWLANNATKVQEPMPPAPVLEPKPEPKFVMTIRTPNGDRKFHFKELDSTPEEVTDEPPQADLQPVTAPVSRPAKPAARTQIVDEAPAPDFSVDEGNKREADNSEINNSEFNTGENPELNSNATQETQEEAPANQPGS
jgi:pilus assembly protein CpaB